MRLHPRLFNRFLIVTAAFSAAAILFFGIRYQANQEEELREHLGNGVAFLIEPFPTYDTPGDSVRVVEYAGRWVMVQFWSTWSDPSIAALRAIPARADLIVIAAAVRDDSTSVFDHMLASNSDHRFVNGTRIFQTFKFPGVPSYVLFDPEGRLHSFGVGFDGPDAYSTMLP